MRRSTPIALGLILAYASASLISAQDPASQDPATTGQKKRQGRRPSTPDAASSTPSPAVTTTPKPPKEPKPPQEPKQAKQKKYYDPAESARRAQQAQDNQTIVFGDSATKRYYTTRCDPSSAELLMMNRGEAVRMGFRSAKCPGNSR